MDCGGGMPRVVDRCRNGDAVVTAEYCTRALYGAIINMQRMKFLRDSGISPISSKPKMKILQYAQYFHQKSPPGHLFSIQDPQKKAHKVVSGPSLDLPGNPTGPNLKKTRFFRKSLKPLFLQGLEHFVKITSDQKRQFLALEASPYQ